MKLQATHTLIALTVLAVSTSALASPRERMKSCQADVQKYCANVEAGRGRIARCLNDNTDKLTDDCKKSLEELKKKRQERKPKAKSGNEGS